MIHDVFIMGMNRICWRYCQGEKQGSAQRLHGSSQEWVQHISLRARSLRVVVSSDVESRPERWISGEIL